MIKVGLCTSSRSEKHLMEALQKEIPMVEVFIETKILVGHYCLLCHAFVPSTNVELEVMRQQFLRAQRNE